MLEAGDVACAMEASSIAISQRRLVGTQFAAVGFTNFSQDHLDFHGDLERYFAAKAELFDGRFPRAVNADDPAVAPLDAELRFGVDSEAAEVRCEAFELRPDRTELFVRTPHRARSRSSRSLRGRFNVDNVLCAVALALLLDVPLGAIELRRRGDGRSARPLRAGRGRPGLRRDRRLRAHARRHRGRAGLGAPARDAAACCACSARAATATRPSARSWARLPRPGPTGST